MYKCINYYSIIFIACITLLYNFQETSTPMAIIVYFLYICPLSYISLVVGLYLFTYIGKWDILTYSFSIKRIMIDFPSDMYNS